MKETIRLSAKNPARIRQLLSVADPTVNWSERDASNIRELYMEVERKDILKLVQSEFWPQAVNPALVVSDDNQKQLRASSIIHSFVRENIEGKRFLDFGCGEGHTVLAAKKKEPRTVIGYDIVKNERWGDDPIFTTEWSRVIEAGPYDAVLVYDVLDHIVDENTRLDVMQKIRGVLSNDAKIYMRCHPFTSRHGTHLYTTLNRAYAHLFLNNEQIKSLGGEQEACHKTLRPKRVYRDLFTKAGLTIKAEDTVIEEPEAIILELSHLILHHWAGDDYVTDENTLRNVILQQFVDYVLVHDGNVRLQADNA